MLQRRCEKELHVSNVGRVRFTQPNGRYSPWNFDATIIISYIMLHSTVIGLLYDSGLVSSYPDAIRYGC